MNVIPRMNGTSIIGAVASQSTDVTLAADSFFTSMDATSGNKVVTLPAAAGNGGIQYVVKKIDSSGNTVTIARAGSDLIDGATSKVIAVQYNSYKLISDGVSNWYVI